MKKDLIKKIATVLCVVMAFTLFAACGKQEINVEPQKSETIEVLDSVVFYFNGKPEAFTVGDTMTTDGYLQIKSIKDRYDSTVFTYGESGEFLTAVKTANDDGDTETEEWVYENGEVVSGTYRADTFYSDRNVTVFTKKNESGQVTKLTENTLITDKDDGTVETRIIEYDFSYDENGRVKTVNYYSDGKLDHATNVTYNENGNILVFSNVGSSLGEYIRMEFNYKQVEATEDESYEQTDSFMSFMNTERLVSWFV